QGIVRREPGMTGKATRRDQDVGERAEAIGGERAHPPAEPSPRRRVRRDIRSVPRHAKSLPKCPWKGARPALAAPECDGRTRALNTAAECDCGASQDQAR